MQIAWKTTTRRATRDEEEEILILYFQVLSVFQVQYHPEYPADTTPFNICSHCRWLSFQAKINLPTEKHSLKKKKKTKDVHEDCRSLVTINPEISPKQTHHSSSFRFGF